MASIVRSIGGYKPPFPIPKRSQLIIRAHNVSNPDCSPLGTRSLEFASYDFPGLHHLSMLQNTIIFGALHAFQVTRI